MMKTNYLAVTLSIIILNICISFSVKSTNSDIKNEPQNSLTSLEKANLLKAGENDIILGNPNAKIVVVEFSSPSCYHCADFHKNVIKDFLNDYVNTGKVAYYVRDIPSDRQALSGSLLMRCAPKEQYYDFMNVLFEQQNNWLFKKDFQEILAQIANLGGINAEQYQKCQNDENIKKIIMGNISNARSLKVFVTPTIFINGELYNGKHKYSDFKEAIDKLLK